MNRPLFPWAVYAICLVVTFTAVGWLTQSAWQADQARQQALIDSEIRNALWRLDSLVAPLLAIEVSRPPLSHSFASTPMLAPKLIKGYVSRESTGDWFIRRYSRQYDREPLAEDSPFVQEDWTRRLASASELEIASVGPHNDTVSDLILWPPNAPRGQAISQSQTILNQSNGPESQNRNQLLQQLEMLTANSQSAAQPAKVPAAAPIFTPMQPVWINGDLVFARQAPVSASTSVPTIEICWLNWPEWESLLLTQLVGLSVPLKLVRSDVESGENEDSARWRMVSLPMRLEPLAHPQPGPLTQPLMVIWGLLAIVAVAFGTVLHQTLALSERRATFVSAVTHELRTPLTTFRLYTEILSEGLATDPRQRQEYYATLNREANRLTHLVENVLAFARLEHGRSTARNESITGSELVARCQPRLEQRTADTMLGLTIQVSSAAGRTSLTTNVLAVEQILFNLIDNSCKYAGSEIDPRVLIEVQARDSRLLILVSDFGPGLSTTARRSLFQPFQKSSNQAAESAPGIGLGLALSFRLSRELKGDLKFQENRPTGVCFELRLPLDS